VSKYGMMIDPERMQSIANLTPPSSKTSIQSFLGKMNFIRHFVPSFFKMAKSLPNIIKKDVIFKRGSQENEDFHAIRQAITKDPSLMSPDFAKDFTLYNLVSDTSYVVLLTQNMMTILKSPFHS
jgi:hypothetical protein